MKIMLVGVGASGNKAVLTAIEKNVVSEEDTMLVNSTSKDIPKDYSGEVIIISPDNYGCGKEINVARQYAIDCIKAGKFNIDRINEYDSIIFVTSTEGGTGSGATPVIAQFVNKIYGRNVHIIAFTGFEEDVRGISNTLQFFKNLDENLMIQTISNSSFLREASNNRFKAEQLANEELAQRIRIITGMDFIESTQNIDNMEVLKLANTAGYMTAEKVVIKKPLTDQNDFNKYLRNMIMESHSIRSANPGTARVGMILNIDEESEDAVDYQYTGVVEAFGKPYEFFTQKQWDGKQEYIAMIISGMKMPMEAIQAMYDRYIEATQMVNKNSDSFFSKVQDFTMDENDKVFDMIKDSKDTNKTMSVDDFLKNL